MLGLMDEEQLAWAAQQGRVIYSYNAADFCRLHSAWIRGGRRHGGIVIGDQQTTSIGVEMRRQLKLADARTSETMENCLEFLSNWG